MKRLQACCKLPIECKVKFGRWQAWPYTEQPVGHEATLSIYPLYTPSSCPRRCPRWHYHPPNVNGRDVRSYMGPSNRTRRRRSLMSCGRSCSSGRVDPLAGNWPLGNRCLWMEDRPWHRWQRKLGSASRWQWTLNKNERCWRGSTGHGLQQRNSEI